MKTLKEATLDELRDEIARRYVADALKMIKEDPDFVELYGVADPSDPSRLVSPTDIELKAIAADRVFYESSATDFHNDFYDSLQRVKGE